MHIRITKPFYERAMSPLAFQPNEMLQMPDDVAKRLIASGHAQEIQPVIAPAKRKRKETR